MKYFYKPEENERVPQARESFSGRLLINNQFDDFVAVVGILYRGIHTSGAFADKLSDFAYAMARSDKFDAMRSETIIRDLFKEITGQTMNQMREALSERAQNLTDQERQSAYQYACDIGPMIENGNKMTFNRAFAHQAQTYARELGITDAAAKNLMKEEFKAVEESELYDWGKELEEHFYRPQIEAEKQRRDKPEPDPESSARPRQTQRRASRPGPSGP